MAELSLLRKAANIRKTLQAARVGQSRFDVSKVLKAILVRRDYMVHVRGMFPSMSSYIEDHGTIAWYTRTFGLNHLGEKGGHRVENADEEEEAAEKGEQETVASSYTCLKPLITFCEKMMRGTFDIALCKLTNDSIAGKSLNLANQEDSLKNILADIAGKYAADFPPKKESSGEARVTHDGMEVIKSSTLQDKADYEIELDKYLKASAENEAQQIKEYIMTRVAFVIDDLTDDLPNKISKASQRSPRGRCASTLRSCSANFCMSVCACLAC